MAGNKEDFTNALVYVNGKQLTLETSLTVKRTSGSQPVKTVALGYAGESPGSAMCEITVENAVRSDDFEVDPGSFIQDLSVVELTIFAAGKTATTKGCIYEDNFSHAVDTASKLAFSFRGRYPTWD